MTVQTSRRSQFERTKLDSTNVELDTPVQDVNVAQGVAIGIALPDVRGIENEAPTQGISKALADEQFMAEKVDIQLHEPGTEFEHQFVEATVNGEYVCLRRDANTVYTIKRSHVAVIAQAKVQRVVQKKITLADGSMGYEEKAVLQPLYPFMVVRDTPRGGAWLRQVLQGN